MSSKHSREIWVLKWTRKKINFIYFQLGYYNLAPPRFVFFLFVVFLRVFSFSRACVIHTNEYKFWNITIEKQ